MAKKKFEPSEIKCDMIEFLGALTESDKHDWCIGVARLSWNDNPAKLEIRHMNMRENAYRKGIGLTDESVDKLVDLLLENDYGSMESLTSALERKRSRFSILGDAANCFDGDDDNDDMLYIHINVGDDD